MLKFREMPEQNFHKTITIGAGISGIKSSIELTKHGVDNIIIEARDRLGGRLHTIKTETGIPMDLGASWFHDCLVNPLLKKTFDKGNVNFYYDDGKWDIITKKHGVVDDNLKLQPVADEFNAYLKQICTKKYTPSTDVSVREACYNYLKQKKFTLTKEQLEYAPQLVRYFELWIGSSWDLLSARCITDDAHYGRNAMVTNGYITLYNDELQELVKLKGRSESSQLIESGDIVLNKAVYKIAFDDKIKRIRILTRDRDSKKIESFECEYLICSIPLSVLKLQDYSKEGSIEWQPPLPTDIRAKLNRTSFSSLGKVFLEFSNCFWPNGTDRFLCLSEPDTVLTGALEKDTPLTFSKNRDSSWYRIDPRSKPDPFKYSVLFMNLSRAANVPVLLALIAEPLTQYIEGSSKEKIWQFFEPLVANISGKQTVPAPVSINHTVWSSDPFARGSYTGLTVGDDPDACIDSLIEAKNIFDGSGRVRFVGEGVTKEASGCVHGAWTSAKREADKIVRKINRSKL